MLERELILLNNAYESYNLKDNQNISKDVLDYIRGKIVDNKAVLEQVIEHSNDNVTFDEILSVFDEEVSKECKYKQEKTLTRIDNKYVYGIYTTSIGNIVVECEDTLTALRYYINAIKSRNTITISDTKYNEVSAKSALLIIFCEALDKFNIDMNLIMLIPYEECYYENFDKVIYEDNKKPSINKNHTSKVYLYLEDSFFKDQVEKEKIALKFYNREAEIITGDFYKAVKKINEMSCDGAAIYTGNRELGFKFLNLVHAKNVFVNTSLSEMEVLQDINSKEELYMKKKVMYPLNESKKAQKQEQKVVEEKVIVAGEQTDFVHEENTELVEVKASPWYRRIWDKIINFFRRKKN